jgi:hypothetical protein
VEIPTSKPSLVVASGGVDRPALLMRQCRECSLAFTPSTNSWMDLGSYSPSGWG